MTDAELSALAALIYLEATERAAQVFDFGVSVYYPRSEASEKLVCELKQRGVLEAT